MTMFSICTSHTGCPFFFYLFIWCCRVARYRSEAVLLAKGASSLKNDLSDCQYKLECQSKELASLRLEKKLLKGELAATQKEKEELLERWLEEKREEAVRLNKHNATQER